MKKTKLICMKMNQRYFLLIICMFGFLLNTINQLVFMTLMADVIFESRDLKQNHQDNYDVCPVTYSRNSTPVIEEFHWMKFQQVYVLMGYSLGYAIGKIPIGLAIDLIGAKTIYGYSVFVPGMLSLLTPICARTSPYALAANRVLSGILSAADLPSMVYFAARWFPSREYGYTLSLMFLGLPLGCIIHYSIGHHMFYVFRKWTSMFYMSGVLSAIWVYIWYTTIWEDPFDHPYISMRELELLVIEIPMYATDDAMPEGGKWPWKSILTSSSLWTLAFVNLSYTWYFYAALVIIPVFYFTEVLDTDINKHENVLIFVFVLMVFTMLGVGVTSDLLVNSRLFTLTHVTKGRFTICCVVGSILLLGITHTGCFMTSIFLYSIGTVLLLGVGFTCYALACLNVAPNYVGATTALTSFISDLTAPLEVVLAHELTPHGSLQEWRKVSYILSALIIFTAAVFLKWGNCELQSWNIPKKTTRKRMKRQKAEIGEEGSPNFLKPKGNEDFPKLNVLLSKEFSKQNVNKEDNEIGTALTMLGSLPSELSEPESQPQPLDQLTESEEQLPANQMLLSRAQARSRILQLKSSRLLNNITKTKSQVSNTTNN